MPQSNEPDNKKPAEDFIVTFDNLPRYSYFIVVGSSRMLYKGAEGEVVDPGGYREHINYDTKVIKVNRAQFG